MTDLYRQQSLCPRALWLAVLLTLPGCGEDSTSTTEGTTETSGGSETAGPAACTGNFLPGDLVITEVMANPSGSDDGFEWFEIYNPGDTVASLKGVTIILSRSDGSSEKQHTIAGDIEIAPGGYVTAGNIADASQLVFIDYAYGEVLGNMSNGGGWLRLQCGDEEVDSVTWLTDRDGASHTFDGYLKPPDAVTNDDLALWCEAQSFPPDTFLTGDLGTPQLPNDYCPPPTGFCYEGDDLRELDPPAPGDLVISEIMPDPLTSDDTEEWFEVYVARDVDLNELVLARDFGDSDFVTIGPQAQCERVTAGAYLVFAVSEAQTAGLPQVDYVYKKSKLNLVNSDGSLTLAHSEQLIDGVSYTDSEPGQSLSLDPDMLDADLNDGEDAFCLGLGDYGPGGQGTPGMPNPNCGQCLDAMGNPRDPIFPNPGELVITEFMANPAGADGDREWIEVFAGADVDLMHVHVGKSKDTEPPDLSPLMPVMEGQPGSCLEVPANTYLVLAREPNPSLNDLPHVDFLHGLSLSNSGNQHIYLFQGQDIELDHVAYTELSVADGYARAFLGELDPELNNNADDDMMWCTPTDTGPKYGQENFGTPGQANQCE